MGEWLNGVIDFIFAMDFWSVVFGLCMIVVAISVVIAIVEKISSVIRQNRNRRDYYTRTPLHNNASATRSSTNSMTYIELGEFGRQDVYVFNYERVGSVWRAYIMTSPNYEGKSS